MSKTLEDFQAYLAQMARLNHATTLLYWDMETEMPEDGFDRHSDALTYFSTEHFKMSTSEELKRLLDALSAEEEYSALDSNWQFIVDKMKKDYEENARVPVDFYSEFVQAQSESGQAWEKAKNESDFAIFAPYLQKMIDMIRRYMEYARPGEDVYNAMLDRYEEGMDSDTIDRLFDDLKAELVPLVRRVLAAKQPDDGKFHRYYDNNQQRKLQKYLLEYIGFDFKRGTVGESMHPFTLNFSSQDVRVTNHFYDHDPLCAIYSAIHEGGHAIFEQNVNPQMDGTVAGSCSYMGIHESQSRFFENILGRNLNFWKPIYSDVQDILPGFAQISLAEFEKEINHVRNSLIRTDADELTYCFHVIIRYEIEKAIFRDHVTAEELPALWNQKMQEYLDIVPDCDATGILQDMHWSDGSFGYFPSYLLGSIYDGMFLEKLEEELGTVDNILADGRIKDITGWLNTKIHVYGNTRKPKDVIAQVCGKEVSAAPIIRYFTEKYTRIYNL